MNRESREQMTDALLVLAHSPKATERPHLNSQFVRCQMCLIYPPSNSMRCIIRAAVRAGTALGYQVYREPGSARQGTGREAQGRGASELEEGPAHVPVIAALSRLMRTLWSTHTQPGTLALSVQG